MKKLSVIDHSDSDTEDMADLRRWALLESSNWNLESKSKGAARAGLGEDSGRPPGGGLRGPGLMSATVSARP